MVDQESVASYGGRALVLADPVKYPEAAGLANGYFNPLGCEPGIGWVLMLKVDLDAVVASSPYNNVGRTLVLEAGGSAVLSSLFMVSAVQISAGLAADPNAVYLVKLADARWHARMATAAVTYNVRCPAPPALSGPFLYYLDSLNASDPWTWSEMVGNIWALMPGLGVFPGLPISPDGIPEDFQFLGVPAMEALSAVLDRISCSLVYDPVNATFSIVQTGVVQPGLADLRSANQDYIKSAAPLDVQSAIVPETVVVYFHRRDVHYGSEPSTKRGAGSWATNSLVAISVASGVPGVVAGTKQPVWDDLPALVDFSGSVVNGADLATRAAERSAAYVTSLTVSAARSRVLYSGVIPQFLPGSEVEAVHWRDFGGEDAGGYCTEVLNGPALPARSDVLSGTAADPSAGGAGLPAAEVLAPPDIGRRSFPLHPPVLQLVVIDGTAGPLTTASGDNLFSGKVLRVDVTQAFSGDAPYVPGEACWVAVSNLLTGSKFSSCVVTQGERYFARLNGTVDVSDDVRPLYVVHRPENHIERITIPGGGLAPGASASVTLPDGRTVTVTNQTENTFGPGDRATAYLDFTDGNWYVTGGGTGGGAPDNMAIVSPLSANADGSCKWAGTVNVPNTPGGGYCTDQFPAGIDCFLVVLNKDNGSASADPATLDVDEHYIGRYIGDWDNGDDTFTPVYAIRIESGGGLSVVRPDTANADADCLWDGVVIAIVEPWEEGSCDDEIATEGEACRLLVLNRTGGSFSAVHFSLKTDEYYLGKFLGRDDDGVPYYAIRVDPPRVWSLFLTTLNTNVARVDATALVDPGPAPWVYAPELTPVVPYAVGNPLGLSGLAASVCLVAEIPDLAAATVSSVRCQLLAVVERYGGAGGTDPVHIEGYVYQEFTKASPTFRAVVTHDDAGLLADGAVVEVVNFAKPPGGANLFVFDGRSGDSCLFRRDELDVVYRVIWVESAFYTNRKLKAYLSQTLMPDDELANVRNVTMLDGSDALLPFDFGTAANLLKWAGKNGDLVFVAEQVVGGVVSYVLEAVAWGSQETVTDVDIVPSPGDDVRLSPPRSISDAEEG